MVRKDHHRATEDKGYTEKNSTDLIFENDFYAKKPGLSRQRQIRYSNHLTLN